MRRADNVPIVLKYGSFNFLEPSGPVQARTGVDLPFLPQIRKVVKIHPVGAELFHAEDRHDDQSNGRVSQFCERA